MSDRIAVMNHGKVEQIGPPEELYERPATRFVADFMGTTNLLKGSVEAVGGAAATVRLDGGDVCRVADAKGRGVGEAIEISIRPEAVSIGGPGVGGEGSIEGRVEQSAYLGANVQYQVRSQGGVLLSVIAPKSGRRFVAGDDVEIGWSPDDALVVAERGSPAEETR